MEAAPVFIAQVQAAVVRLQGFRFFKKHLDSFAWIFPCHIERVRTGMHYHKGIHFKTQSYGIPGLALP